MKRYNIPERCKSLGITQTHLRTTTAEKTGAKIFPSDWSNYVSGNLNTPKGEMVLAMADRILTDLENRMRA